MSLSQVLGNVQAAKMFRVRKCNPTIKPNYAKQGFTLPFNFLLAELAANFVLPRNNILCFDVSSAPLALKEILQLRDISKRHIDISTGYRFWVVVRAQCCNQ